MDVTEGEIAAEGQKTHIKANEPSTEWVNAFVAARADWHQRLDAKGLDPLKIHPGLVITGPNIVSQPEYVQRAISEHPKLVGFEMELAGVTAAMRALETRLGRPRWAMLKAVSDHADLDNNRSGRKGSTKSAAHAAALLVHSALDHLPVGPEPTLVLQPAPRLNSEDELRDLDKVLPRIENEIAQTRTSKVKPLEIANLALDGERTLPWLRDYLASHPALKNVRYRILMLDYRAPDVRKHIGGQNITAEAIQASLRSVEQLNRAHGSRNIRIEARLYRHCLPIHGFTLGRTFLLIGDSIFVNANLKGAVFPYEGHTRGSSSRADHLFDLYDSWFEVLWNEAVPHVTLPKAFAPLVIGHRGFRRSGSPEENTLKSIEAGLKAGADGVEIDVQVTADGVPILMHDKSIERTTGRSGEVQRMSWEQIGGVNQSNPYKVVVPTLDVVCDYMAPKKKLLVMEIIDFKNWRTIFEVAQRKIDGQQCELVAASFDHGVVAAIKDLHPEQRTCAIMEAVPADPLGMVAATRCDIVSLGYESFSKALAAEFRRADVEVWVWTVNRKSEARRLAQAGVTGIITDRPDLVVGDWIDSLPMQSQGPVKRKRRSRARRS